jgi:NitT/TauT family transport system permease protein
MKKGRVSTALLKRYGPPAIAGALLLAAWQIVPPWSHVSPLLIPTPSAVVISTFRAFQRGLLVGNFLVTLTEALGGFLIGSLAAVACAFAITRSQLVERALMPYLVGFQALPKVALAPLIVVWIGIGIESKIAIAAVIAFFPVLINAIIGFSTVEAEKIELMRSLSASRWQEFRIVIFPNSLPFIFAGLNVAIVFSITGALVGEFIGADRGLGNLLMQLNFNMDISGMFGVLLLLAVLGVALHGAVRLLHKRIVFWAEPGRFGPDIA